MTETAKRGAMYAYEMGVLRFIQRDFVQSGVANTANVAEHVFRVAMIAWYIGQQEGADTGEILKLALTHDTPEIRTMDMGVIASQYNNPDEAGAAKDMFADVLPEALEAWERYEERESLEAKIVKDADRLDVILEVEEMRMRGFNVPKSWDDERDTYPSLLFTQTAKDLFKEMCTMHPKEWQDSVFYSGLSKLKQFGTRKVA